MKGRLFSLAAALTMAGSTLAVQPAHAAHVGIAIGVPVYGPAFYGPYYGYPYYPPAVIAVPAAPAPTYVEQQPTVAAAPDQSEGGYWYYCNAPAGYYPSVKTCSAGWQKVPPLPGH